MTQGKTLPNYIKQNVLVMGPTGVGKTYLVKCLAELIGVPMVRADATKFTETGYVGGDVEDLVRDLVTQAEGDKSIAQYGIVYLDEVDKLASSSVGTGRDVSGRGVQTNLLKLMEETEVPIAQPDRSAVTTPGRDGFSEARRKSEEGDDQHAAYSFHRQRRVRQAAGDRQAPPVEERDWFCRRVPGRARDRGGGPGRGNHPRPDRLRHGTRVRGPPAGPRRVQRARRR